MRRICGLFVLETIFLPSRDFCKNQRVLCSLIYTGPAVNSLEECKVQENLSSHEKTFDFILGGFQLTSRETYSHRSRYHLESKGFLQRVVLFWLHAENQRKCKKGAKSIISSPEQLGWPKKGTGSGNENAKANFSPCAVMRYVMIIYLTFNLNHLWEAKSRFILIGKTDEMSWANLIL